MSGKDKETSLDELGVMSSVNCPRGRLLDHLPGAHAGTRFPSCPHSVLIPVHLHCVVERGDLRQAPVPVLSSPYSNISLPGKERADDTMNPPLPNGGRYDVMMGFRARSGRALGHSGHRNLELLRPPISSSPS